MAVYETYYDSHTKGFYQSDINPTIPKTATKITTEKRKELLIGESQGMQISCDENGKPFLKEPEVDLEFLIAQENAWIKGELGFASNELEKVQDSDPKAAGTVSQWRDYRKALRSWSEHKDFPNKESRPISPLVKE